METIDSEEEIIINSKNSFNCDNCELMKHEFDSLYGILRKEKQNLTNKIRNMQFYQLILELILQKYSQHNFETDFEKSKTLIVFELMVLKKIKLFYKHWCQII